MCVASVKLSSKSAAVFAGVVLLSGCAVGPGFKVPAAPEVDRYTKEPLTPRTSSTDAPTGLSQHFAPSRDIPQEWWVLFKSPTLNALIKQSIDKNPTLQSALATLRASKEAVYAQQGKFLPFVQANFNPTRNRTSAALAPVPSSNASVYNLYTAQVAVSYTFDVWGLNRRTVESLQAITDTQHFEVEAAYLTLTSSVALAAINEASLRGQLDATNQLITINTKMLDILRKQFDTGYASRNDVALQ
jgi:outer membrane protein TolC